MIVFALCLSLLVLILIQYILHIQNMEKYLKNLKTLPRLPLFGNMNFFLGKSAQVLCEEIFAIILKSGTPFKIQIGPGSTISYVILMLAMHPNIQEQVFSELHSIYETQDQDTSYEMFQKFDILNRVIKETMRIFPVGYSYLRTPKTNIRLINCLVPKGVSIVLSAYTLHRRRDLWGEDAESFNPDHFLPENVQKRHAYSFLPFSGGMRNCIGYQYAMFTMRVMLSAILRKYKFTTNLTMSELRPKFEVTLRLLNKHMVGIERRRW